MRGVQVTDDGDVVLSQGAINGFLGGSVAPHPPQPAAHRTRLPASVVPAAPSLHPPRRHATPPHRAPLRTHRCIPSLRHSQHPYATPPPRPLLDPLLDPSPAGGRGGHADSHLRQARSGQGPAQVPLLRGHWHHSVRLTTPPPRLTAEPHSQGAAPHKPPSRASHRVARRTSHLADAAVPFPQAHTMHAHAYAVPCIYHAYTVPGAGGASAAHSSHRATRPLGRSVQPPPHLSTLAQPRLPPALCPCPPPPAPCPPPPPPRPLPPASYPLPPTPVPRPPSSPTTHPLACLPLSPSAAELRRLPVLRVKRHCCLHQLPGLWPQRAGRLRAGEPCLGAYLGVPRGRRFQCTALQPPAHRAPP